MVPAAIIVLDALPLNPSGKVDRKALPAPEAVSDAEYEAPEGAVEQSVAAIWAEVLGVEQVGRRDNFFALGGHSLLALRVLERLRAQGRRAEVRQIFLHPELATFAQAIVSSSSSDASDRPPAGTSSVPPTTSSSVSPVASAAGSAAGSAMASTDAADVLITLTPEEIDRIEATIPGGAPNIQDVYPLAPLQEGILFHHLLQPDADAYVTAHLIAFDSEARLRRFVDSFNRVIERHDILRTAVLWEGLEEPVQVVCRETRLAIEWLSPEDGPVAVRLEEMARPGRCRIDVRRAPMLRAIAGFDAVQDRWLLQLPSHHLVTDHSTLADVVEEIALIQQDRAAELPEPVPFRRFVAQARLGVSRAAHEAFFSEMLRDVTEPTAPFGVADVRGDGTRLRQARQALPDALAAAARQQARRHGVGVAALFHLAWALVLGRTTGRHRRGLRHRAARPPERRRRRRARAGSLDQHLAAAVARGRAVRRRGPAGRACRALRAAASPAREPLARAALQRPFRRHAVVLRTAELPARGPSARCDVHRMGGHGDRCRAGALELSVRALGGR